MSEGLKRLLNSDGISSIPPYIDQEKDSKMIASVLGDKKIKNYIKRYQQNEFSDTLWLVSPLDLLIAGRFLRVIRKFQSNSVYEHAMTKVSIANLNDNQIFDTLAELFVAGSVATHYKVEFDKPTIAGKSGLKDADIYVPEHDIYIEVKNFNMWFSDHAQRLMKIAKEYSEPDTQISIDPNSKNKDQVVVTGNETGIQSVADTTPRNNATQLRRMLKDAAKKFDSNQSSALVMTNVMNSGTANRVVLDWYKSQDKPTIKYVAITGPRHADTGKREVHVLELVEDKEVKIVLNKVFAEPDFIKLEDEE